MHPFELPIRVIYADTDAMGIVYHANYIKWFETGRTELMRSLGISWSEMEPLQCYFPVSKLSCHYLLPARYDDLLILKTHVDKLKRASISFSYSLYDEGKERVLVRGSTLHACTDEKGRIIRIPEVIHSRIKEKHGEGENAWHEG
ncbi:MAG: acyl-CoA thioesterase [Syntrophales bacterium]|nr:acyl-CoA thioesterase [Syntrophales bacterium]MCK9527250.1 acyl-CoA thioesterase [Syntrophales bacterium]MDX9921280.1 thioesterase family protein [Syntrophales bacterium]